MLMSFFTFKLKIKSHKDLFDFDRSKMECVEEEKIRIEVVFSLGWNARKVINN